MLVKKARVINCHILCQQVFHLVLLNLFFRMCGDRLLPLLAIIITMSASLMTLANSRGSMVESYFDKKIISVQTDWGGEYQRLNSFFQRIGIAHHVSCPHAHQQNGSAERKHRHIVEVGLSLLAHASMPLKFWDEAFITATYLINRLPSKVIHGQTPLHHLFKQTPDYHTLCTFGCA